MAPSPVIDKSLQAALVNAPVIFWTIDTAGVVQQAIGKGMSRQGLAPRKVVGQSLFEIYRDYPEFIAHIRKALAGESVQFVLETFGGVFDRRLEPIRSESGAITGVAGVSVDVTAEQRAQHALQQSEEQFRNLVEGSIQGIAIVQNERPVFVNTAAARIFGYADAVQMTQEFNLARHFRPEVVQQILGNMQRRLGGEPVPPQWQTEGTRCDGTAMWIEVMVHVVMWGGAPAIQIAFSDVTARVRSEQQSKQREEQYRDLLEGSLQGVLIRRNHRNLFANEAMARMLGYASGADLLPLANADFMTPEEVVRRAEETERRARGEPVSNSFEVELVRRDGAVITCMAFRRVVQWEGEPAFQITLVDITDRKRAELQLRQSEEQFRALTEGSLQGIVIHRDRKIVFVNQAYVDLLGYSSPEELYALDSLDETIAPEQREWVREIARARAAGQPAPETYELVSLKKDGTRGHKLIFSRTVTWQGQPATQSTVIDISDRKRAEQALRESEWQLARAQEAAHIGTWYREDQTGVTRWSDEFYRLLGLVPGAIPASSEAFYAFVHADDLQRFHDLRRLGLNEVGHLAMDVRVRRADGQQRLMRVVADRVEGDRGRPLALVGTLEDITDRRAGEDALRLSEQRFRDLVEGSVQGIAIVQDMTFQFANAAYCRMYGFESLEALQAEGSSQNRVAPRDRDRVAGYYQARMAGKPAPSMYEIESVRRDGTQFTVLAMARRVEWNGRPAAQLTVIDVTEQRTLASSLRLKEHAIQSAAEAIAFGDLTGKLLEVNPAFVKMWGLPNAEAAVGRRGIEFWWTPGELELAVEVIRRTGTWSGETVARRATGEKFPVEVRVSTVRDDAGKPVWLMASIVDITQRKRTEERQRELEEQLFQAQKMESIGRLVGGIAHDFNNMLTPMLGYAELALAAIDPKEPSHRHVQVIRSSAERAADLTRKMLVFGRRRHLRKVHVDIGPEVQSVVDMLKRVIHENVIIDQRIAPDVGKIHADPALIHQLIMNLALNARDAMPHGGRLVIAADRAVVTEPSERPGGLKPGPYVRITVSDTGHGMDAETLSRIFDPFFTTKAEGKGTGLGLSVVYGIVNQHDGQITVSSKPGEGATFLVYLPAPVVAQAPAAPREATAHHRQSATVLVVEDDPQVLSLVSAILGGLGHTLVEASGPDEALRVMQKRTKPVDLLLCDVVMPNMNGPALAKRIVSQSPKTRVLFMSGYAKDVAVEHGLQEQNAQLIDKPFTVDELTRAVRRALERA